nr:transcription factor MYB48-like [Ipomoea batatas]
MEEETLRKGPWLEEEDEKLAAAVASLGERRWDALAKASEQMNTSWHSCTTADRASIKDGSLGSSADSSEVVELPDYTLVSSPYEERLWNWMSSWSHEDIEMEHHGDGESCSRNQWCCQPQWTSDYSCIGTIWDYASSSIWDSTS